MPAAVAIGIAKYLLHNPFWFAKTFRDFIKMIIEKAVLRISPYRFFAVLIRFIHAKTLDYACFI